MGRALDVLLTLGADEAADNGGLGVVRVAELLDRDKSQVSRTLKTLAEHGFVDRDPDTLEYRLGWQLYTLAARTGRSRLLALAPPYLRRLVDELGETAHLSVLEGDEVLTLLSERSPRLLQASDWSGHRVPAHGTSSGRALLLDTGRASGGARATPPSTGSSSPAWSAPRRRCVTSAGASWPRSTSRGRSFASASAWTRPAQRSSDAADELSAQMGNLIENEGETDG